MDASEMPERETPERVDDDAPVAGRAGVARKRVLRLMRENGLLSSGCGPARHTTARS